MMVTTKELPRTKKTSSTLTVRPPAVAGRFYPGQASELMHVVTRLLDAAPAHPLGNVRAVIAPHAGYVCSGSVAAASFKAFCALSPKPYTVYLLGPAHWRAVNGVGLSSADCFETPLGALPVARPIVEHLLRRGRPYWIADKAHEPEHSLEVELPFLQLTLGELVIVPMLFDADAPPERVGVDLAELLAADDSSLVVVSSDLSHYLPYHEAYAVDRAFLAAVAASDMAQARRGQACGLLPILALMIAAQQLHWQPHILAYANSGDTCGPRDEVVGYGAVAYTAEANNRKRPMSRDSVAQD